MENYLLISDAAKEVCVESHVLRYWEEELHLPIKRNELGHRYYTTEDVERFRQIKSLKEKGLQLKAIRMILKDGKLNVLSENDEREEAAQEQPDEKGERETKLQESMDTKQPHSMGINIVESHELAVRTANELSEEAREEKAKRLQWLLRQLISDTLRENNQELCREIKESVVKELDYQFRSREEREEERERVREQRSEEYYKKMDELLRKKSSGRVFEHIKGEKKAEEKGNITAIRNAGKKGKKKRHFIF